MLSALASADAITWISICVKALVYASALMAAGSVLCIAVLRGLPQGDLRRLRRIAVICALGAAALSLTRLPVRASFLMGGTWQGAFDPVMLGMVADSPLGFSIALRLIGLGLILLILIPRRVARLLATAGAVLTLASFVSRGHALSEPCLLLSALIMLRLLGIAFWIGALAPLHRIARTGDGATAGQVAQDFDRKAVWVGNPPRN